MSKNSSSKSVIIYVLIAIILILIASIALVLVGSDSNSTDKYKTATEALESDQPVSIQYAEDTDQSTIDSLNYLIEEEKMAHDVYTYMFGLYGTRVFSNIASSETAHQASILQLLETRNQPDPTLNAPGKFASTELQKLYDDLIVLGQQSPSEAYKVGVAIEQKDIADLQSELQKTSDQDIKTVLGQLKMASEKHLAAFSRQL